MKTNSQFARSIVALCLLFGACSCVPSSQGIEPVVSGKPGSEAEEVYSLVESLDPDGNGLYDDVERKALLDFLQTECQELEAAYDADGDGKVTVLEQTQGRDPLSMRIPRRFLESSSKVPWAINMFPEWIMSGYFQEDVALGSVSEHAPRGTVQRVATQKNVSLQPQKRANRSGVEFDANSGQFISMKGVRDARWSYRWCIFTFRIDAGAGNDQETVLLDLNKGNSSNKSSPRIWYNKQTGLNIQYVGYNTRGLDRRIMTTQDIVADGSAWTVVVCGIRYGQMFASVNGIPLSTATRQPDRFSGDWPHNTTSYLGGQQKGNTAWAYDALVFGMTEPSEAMVRKMTGWAAHRLSIEATLPADHPYRDKRPVMDEEDFPYRYVHDDEKWNAWGKSINPGRYASEYERALIKAQDKLVNAGGPRVDPQGFERVFYDDFRADRVKASTSGEGDLWVGPGFNIAVGADAPLVTPGREPNTYPYDAKTHKQTLSLIKRGNRWHGSAFYSVNDLGHGYTWTGPKIFRIRCMFPKVAQKDLTGGLFPAFWSYDPDFLFWRTSNRIEVDWFEFDGQNGWWLNGLSSHFHYSHIKNIFAKHPDRYRSYKAYSGMLTEEKSKIPGGLFFWDGQFHTWEFVVDRDMTYVNVTVPDADGNDRWVEVCRCTTPATYLERLDLQLDYALRKAHGVPTEAFVPPVLNDDVIDIIEEDDDLQLDLQLDEDAAMKKRRALEDALRQDFVLDWIEVEQKTRDLARTPKPFTATPTLSGAATVGGTITCQPNVEEITDVRYYWFADGYPLTYGVSNTWTITAAEAGTEIRCMVKAVGARDMPEAWSESITIATSDPN